MIIKENKLLYYARNILTQLVPRSVFEKQLRNKLAGVREFDKAVLLDRVNYYNKLSKPASVGEKACALKKLEIFKSPKEYKFDAYKYIRFFDGNLRANFIFGDVVHTEPFPTIQKSRPIKGDNSNAILLKLNRARHFVFVKDKKQFSQKKNMLIGRASVFQEHRIRFMQKFFDHPLCNLGQVNKSGGNPDWYKPKISIAAHLDYKFVLSLEGNDVATNLKWIMSSNSIAVMPKPKHETWFMEGKLIPDHHFIMINDDYSDLEEKLNYYMKNEAAAQAIITNANRHVEQFFDKKQEELIALLVLAKYFSCTRQIKELDLSQHWH